MFISLAHTKETVIASPYGRGGSRSETERVVCANIVRCALVRVYVHFFVSRQRNGTKENALRGSAPKYPVGLCAFCPWGTKLHSPVAPLLFSLVVRIFENKGFVHNPASLAVSAQGDDMMALSRQEKLVVLLAKHFGTAETWLLL